MPSVISLLKYHSLNFSYWFRFADISSGDDSPKSSPDLSEHEEKEVNAEEKDHNIINILMID